MSVCFFLIPQSCWQSSLINYSQTFKDGEKNGLGSLLRESHLEKISIRELTSLCVPIKYSNMGYFHVKPKTVYQFIHYQCVRQALTMLPGLALALSLLQLLPILLYQL